MLIPRKLLKLHEIFSSLNVSTMLKDRSRRRHYLFKRHSMWLDKKKKKRINGQDIWTESRSRETTKKDFTNLLGFTDIKFQAKCTLYALFLSFSRMPIRMPHYATPRISRKNLNFVESISIQII